MLTEGRDDALRGPCLRAPRSPVPTGPPALAREAWGAAGVAAPPALSTAAGQRETLPRCACGALGFSTSSDSGAAVRPFGLLCDGVGLFRRALRWAGAAAGGAPVRPACTSRRGRRKRPCVVSAL